MAAKNVGIQIGIDVDAKAAAAGFDATADAAKRMGDAVETAGDQAARGAADVGRGADAADNLASKSSQATGGLGALSAGFELVGAGEFATQLQAAAMATDFFSGVGDIANLVLESQAVQTAKNAALKAKDIVVTGAQTVATTAQTAAQWALNAAMSANPLALVVIAVVALTAAFVLAYKKSETFRRIVNAAVTSVRDVAGTVIGWLKSHWKLILAILTGPFGLAVLAIAKNWTKIKTAASSAVDFVKRVIHDGFDNAKQFVIDAVAGIVGVVTGLPDKLTNLGTKMFNAGKTIIHKFLDGLKEVGSFAAGLGSAIVNGMIDAINVGLQFINDALPNSIGVGPFSIDLPDNPLPPIGHVGGGGSTSSVSPLSAGTTTVQVNIQGAIDPYSTASQVKTILDRYAGINGEIVHAL